MAQNNKSLITIFISFFYEKKIISFFYDEVEGIFLFSMLIGAVIAFFLGANNATPDRIVDVFFGAMLGAVVCACGYGILVLIDRLIKTYKDNVIKTYKIHKKKIKIINISIVIILSMVPAYLVYKYIKDRPCNFIESEVWNVYEATLKYDSYPSFFPKHKPTLDDLITFGEYKPQKGITIIYKAYSDQGYEHIMLQDDDGKCHKGKVYDCTIYSNSDYHCTWK